MTDFWLSCGHHLLDRSEGGGLLVTDEFLKVYLARPELIPPKEACAHERGLHSALLGNPRRPVTAEEIAAIEDADARENWQLLVAFRDRLLRHRTLEAAYAGLVREDATGVPPLFMNQLVHVILRNALDGVDDARVLRAAELLFRLRAVNENDLVADIGKVLPMSKQGPAAGKVLEADDMAALFGLDMGDVAEPVEVVVSPAGAYQEFCVRGRFHLIPLRDAEPVAEHNRELGHGGGPFALGILPALFDAAQDQVEQFDGRLVGGEVSSAANSGA